jgi:hypothetical protein
MCDFSEDPDANPFATEEDATVDIVGGSGSISVEEGPWRNGANKKSPGTTQKNPRPAQPNLFF